jgi:hypothetical protein
MELWKWVDPASDRAGDAAVPVVSADLILEYSLATQYAWEHVEPLSREDYCKSNQGYCGKKARIKKRVVMRSVIVSEGSNAQGHQVFRPLLPLGMGQLTYVSIPPFLNMTYGSQVVTS